MPPAATDRFFDRLRAALAPAADLPDGHLLTRFVTARDGEAFAELVRRHGPMVLAVCRRVVGDAHLAEDAFQATFLVLARTDGSDIRASSSAEKECLNTCRATVAVSGSRSHI
jgi:hypothetical protein